MADLPELTCPSCGAALTESPRCPSCGLSLEGKRLFDPRHFHWLGVLLSGLVPITMSAVNWGRVGRTRERNLWLILGFLGFLLLFSLLGALPEGARFLGIAVSAGISYYLRARQQPLFAAGFRLGAKRDSAWKGAVAGTSLLIVALALTVMGFQAAYHLRYDRGVKLLDQGRLPEAAAIFERLVQEDPKDLGANFALATCRLFSGNLDAAERGFHECLSLEGVDSAMVFADLAVLEAARGRSTEADSLAGWARAREPAIFTKLYYSDDVATIADSLVQQPR